MSRAGLGHVSTEQGDFVLARTLFTQVLRHGERTGGPLIVLLALQGFTHLAAAEGRADRAVCLCGMATAVRQRMIGQSPPMWPMMQRWLAPAYAQIGERRGEALRTAGEAATLEEAIGFALEEHRPPRHPGSTDEWLALTPRERETVLLLREGLSNREIAGRLVVGERTVETHVHSVLRKLGLRSRHQIADWATAHAVTA
jgi:DNA-binding CsgD family transcriptional regulator